MKNIKNFNQFLNESDEPAADPAAPAASGDQVDPAGKTPPDPTVAGRLFFRELHTHVKYWFTYGTLEKVGELEKTEVDSDKLGLWIRDNSDSYLWKVLIRLDDDESPAEKVEKLAVDTQLYDDNDKSLVTMTTPVEAKEMTEIGLRRILHEARKHVIKAPKNKMDVKRFNRKEGEELTDDIY